MPHFARAVLELVARVHRHGAILESNQHLFGDEEREFALRALNLHHLTVNGRRHT
jgi:hypothetical protein